MRLALNFIAAQRQSMQDRKDAMAKVQQTGQGARLSSIKEGPSVYVKEHHKMVHVSESGV